MYTTTVNSWLAVSIILYVYLSPEGGCFSTQRTPPGSAPDNPVLMLSYVPCVGLDPSMLATRAFSRLGGSWDAIICKDFHQKGTIKRSRSQYRWWVMGYEVIASQNVINNCNHTQKNINNIHFSIAAIFDLGKGSRRKNLI